MGLYVQCTDWTEWLFHEFSSRQGLMVFLLGGVEVSLQDRYRSIVSKFEAQDEDVAKWFAWCSRNTEIYMLEENKQRSLSSGPWEVI